MTSTHTPPAPEQTAHPSAAPPGPEPTGNPTPPNPTRPRRPARRGRLLLLLLIVTGAASAGYLHWGSWWSAPPDESIQLFTVTPRSFPIILREKGELQAANSIDIRCELEGRSTIIFIVDEGTNAQKGDLLVELASDEIDERIREAEIREASARAAYETTVKEYEILQDDNASTIRKSELEFRLAELALEKYREGEQIQQRQTAELAFEKAKSVRDRAKDNLADSEELFGQGFLTRLELEDDRFDVYESEIELKKAKLALEVLDKYTIPMELQQKQADLDEARKELIRTKKSASAKEAKQLADVEAKKSELELIQDKLTKYRDQKAKAKIVAPADGLVVYARSGRWWRNDTRIEKGAQVYERQSLIELPDTSSMKVVIRVHEAKTEMLKEGLPTTVEIEGFSGKTFPGTISKIAVLADSQNRWLNPNLKEYETEVLLDGEFSELKPGITAHVQILVTELTDVLAVPVQAVFAQGEDYYVFEPGEDGPEPLPITIGQASNEYVEVESGLTEGDRVYLVITDAMKRMLDEDEDAPNQRVQVPGSSPAEG